MVDMYVSLQKGVLLLPSILPYHLQRGVSVKSLQELGCKYMVRSMILIPILPPAQIRLNSIPLGEPQP